MVGELSEGRSRAFLIPRLSSPDDCFSSQMDSPESGDTDDVSSENDSLRTYTQKQKVRPKQLPFPVGLLEGKSDDGIVSDNASEWTCEEVKGWVMSIFNNESIAKRFVEEEITGTTLLSQRVLNDDSMERLGLNTIGKKEKFSSSVQKLVTKRGSVNACTSVVGKQLDGRQKGKLTLPDIRSLDPATKSIYLTVRTRIRRATENEFPGNSIPTFRSNPEARKRLDKLVKQLANSCSIEEVNFGEEGIRSHVMSVLNERRRMVTLGHNYEDKRKSSDSASESEGSPACSQMKRQKSNQKSDNWNDTEDSKSSNTDDNSEEGSGTNVDQSSCNKLSVKSAEVITMAIFKETKMKDVKLHKQILPACRYLKVAGVRGKSKPSVTKLLAQAFIDKEYVVVNELENCNLGNLTFNDVTVSSDKDIVSDIKEWLK